RQSRSRNLERISSRMDAGSSSRGPRLLPQQKSLQLAGLGTRQAGDVFDSARIFVRCDLLFDKCLKGSGHCGIASMAGLQHDVRFDDLSALLIGYADDTAFGNRGMQEQ